MKKVLLILGLVISVNMMFAQTATLKIGTLLDPPAGTVLVPVTLEAINNPVIGSNLISSWGWYIGYDAAVLNAGPVNGPATLLNYNPQFPSSNYLTNIIPNNPIPGWNTIAVIYSAAVSGTGNPGSKFFDIQFTYVGGPGATNIIWTSTAAKGDFATKFATNMADDEGNEFTLTLIDGYCGPTPVLGKVWTGAGGDLNWLNPANWAPPGVPTTEDVTINATKAPMVVISGGPATCGALTVALGAGVQIDPTGSLTTNGVYTNNGQLIITSNAAGGAGSFISNGALAGTGTFSFQRNMGATFPQNVNNGWHLISTPVAGFNSDAIWDYFAEWYSEPASTYIQLAGTLPCIPAPTYTPAAGQGMGVKFSINYGFPPYNCPGGTGTIVDFNGPFTSIYTGNQAIPFSAVGATPQHWNLLGNPYPSTIDANLTGWGGSIQTFSGLGYLPWAGGVGFNLIAPTQGFFINTLVNGNFNVTNAMRTHNGTFQKEDIANLVELQVTGNGISDYSFIRFLEEATPGQDQVWDAPKLMSTVDEMPQIYTTYGDNKFSIDARPATSMVPMSFVAGVTGTYTIEAIETSEFQNVVLEDAVTGQQTDLLTGSYTFNYTGAGEVHPFIVHFTPLGTPELAANSINIWAADHNIYVQAPATTGDIVVYNLMGQEVVKTDIEAGLNVIPMTNVNTYYIVKVIGSDVTETGKVFIK